MYFVQRGDEYTVKAFERHYVAVSRLLPQIVQNQRCDFSMYVEFSLCLTKRHNMKAYFLLN
jgi:hypothetical protein